MFALSCTVKKILCQACPAPHTLVRGLAGKPDRVPSSKGGAVQHMGADAETSELECRGKTGYTPSNNQHTVIRHGFLSPLQTGRASALLFTRLYRIPHVVAISRPTLSKSFLCGAKKILWHIPRLGWGGREIETSSPIQPYGQNSLNNQGYREVLHKVNENSRISISWEKGSGSRAPFPVPVSSLLFLMGCRVGI